MYTSDRILSDDYLFSLVDAFGKTASVAQAAGFDGVGIHITSPQLSHR